MLQGIVQGLMKQQGLWRAVLKSGWQLLTVKSTASATATSSAEAASASDEQWQGSAGDDSDGPTAGNAAAAAAARDVSAGFKLTQCPLLNVSICLPSVTGTAPAVSSSSATRQLQMAAAAAAAASGHISEGSSSSSDVAAAASNANNGLLVVVYNSLGWRRREWVRVPVAAIEDASSTVHGRNGSSSSSSNSRASSSCYVHEACAHSLLSVWATAVVAAAAAAAAAQWPYCSWQRGCKIATGLLEHVMHNCAATGSH
jgi:hypothetical protein